MIIAVSSEYGDDFREFVCYKIENGEIKSRDVTKTPDGGSTMLVKQLIGLQTDLLISGRIPETLEVELMEAGVGVITGISGISDVVLKSYLDGTLKF